MIRAVVMAALLTLAGQAHAANRFWVGGGSSAAWNATGNTNWGTASNTQDNASVPGSADDVFFDGVGTGASNSTLSANITINSLDMTGYVNTLTHNAGVTLTTSGAAVVFKFAAGMTYTLGNAATSALSFTNSTGATLQITTAGKIAGNVTITGTTTKQLQDAFTSTGTLTLSTNGVLDTNGQTVSVAATGGTTGSSLTLGSSSITVTTGNWGMSASTVSAGTSTITLQGAAAAFSVTNKTWNNLTFTGSGQVWLYAPNTFNNLTRTGTAVKTDEFQLCAGTSTITITGTFTVNGNSAINRVWARGYTSPPGTVCTINAAAVSVSNADFTDITGAGAASWNISGATGGAGDCAGNTGITFTASQNQYWFQNTGNWSDATKWFLATNGGGGAGRVPLCQDDAYIDVNSITSASQVITADVPRIGRSVDFTGAANTPRWTLSSFSQYQFGSVTLISAMLFGGGSGYAHYFYGRGSYSLDTAGKEWIKPLYLTAPGGTLTIAAGFDALYSLNQERGTLTLAGNITTGGYDASLFITSADALNLGSYTYTIDRPSVGAYFKARTAQTVNVGTSTIKFTATDTNVRYIDGAGKTYNNVWFAGTGTGAFKFLGSNTFNDIRVDNAPRTTQFTAGTTTTVTTFTVAGTAGNLMTVGSVTAAGHNLVKSGGGTITCDYCSISYSTASPGSTWYATNSTDGGNNSGWTFGAPPGGDSPARSMRRYSARLWPFRDVESEVLALGALGETP